MWERKHQQPEDKSLPERRNEHAVVLMPLPQLRALPDHDDLGDHCCVQQGKGEIPVRHFILPQQKQVVGDKRAEEECQVQKRRSSPTIRA